MVPIATPIQACKHIILKPNSVFSAILGRANWSWMPFLLVLAANLLPGLLYFSMIDFDWYTTTLVSAQHNTISGAEEEAFRQAISLEHMRFLTLVGGTLGVIVMNAIFAGYLKLTTRGDTNTHSFSDWYSFGWWISLPTVFVAIISLLLLLLFGSAQMPPTIINPTSLAFLANMSLDSPYLMLGQTLRLESLWSGYLIAVGLAQWTRLPAKTTYIIAAAPYLVVWLVLFVGA